MLQMGMIYHKATCRENKKRDGIGVRDNGDYSIVVTQIWFYFVMARRLLLGVEWETVSRF